MNIFAYMARNMPQENYCFDTKYSVFHDCHLFEATKQTIAHQEKASMGSHMFPHLNESPKSASCIRIHKTILGNGMREL